MKMTHKLLVIVSLSATLFMTGCATKPTQTQQQRIENGVYVAAAIGTSISLQEHPEWRPGFEIALSELKVLEAGPADIVSLMSIIHQLPVKELKSSNAALIIESATLLLADQFGTTEIDKVKDVKPYISAIRRGMERGLGMQATNASLPVGGELNQ